MLELPPGTTIGKIDGDLDKFMSTLRANAIRECVTWLARNHQKYPPLALAYAMADDLLPEDDTP